MAPKQEKKELPKKPRGMYDILEDEYRVRAIFIEKTKAIAEFYGFKPIQTPHMEKLEMFTRAVGETTDIVEKEMYNVKIKGGEKLVLRPEGTAPIVRAYIEHGMQSKPQPVLLYYTGAFFRHEKPQKGRRREHQQFGLEVLGESDSIIDALIIKAFLTILDEAAGLKSVCVHLNSIGDKECRKIYQKELLAFYRKKANQVCTDCSKRMKVNPLRLLDCKNEKCIEIKSEAPQIINYLCEDCKNHFKDLLEILDSSNIPYYIDHYLVRGLDYYSRTAFEFFVETEPEKTEEPVKKGGDTEGEEKKEKTDEKKEQPVQSAPLALGGGGRYDMLSNILGNKNIPGVGGAIGIDRIVEHMMETKKRSPTQKPNQAFFIQLGSGAKYKSLTVLEILRKAKIKTSHSLNKNSLKSQLKIASKLKVPFALILGQKEALEDTIIVRNMESASQETIPIAKLSNYLKRQ
ncbi:histidine--tRNA ligase [Patescibacteria group bacterium]